MFSPEFELLLQSLRLDDHVVAAAEAERITGSDSVDWDELLARSDLHSVRPQLARMISGVDEGVVPAGFREKISNEYQENLVRQLRFVSEFFRIRKILDEAGISMVPFKGFWLAHDAYGNLADHELQDVDVFINERDLERIKVLMEENGYIVEPACQPYSIEEIRHISQEYNFVMMQDGVSTFYIEFHWGICPPGYGMDIRLEDLASQTMMGIIQGQELQVFTPSAHLLLVVMHHGGKDRFIKLKHVLDIALIMKKHEDIDWEWVINTARRFHAEKLIYIGVRLASVLTGLSIPEGVRVQAGTREISSLAMNRIRLMMKPPGYWYSVSFNFSNWLFRVRSRTGLGTKIRLTAETGKWILFRPRIAVN